MRNKKRWLAMMLAAAMAFTAPGTSLMGTVSVYAADIGADTSDDSKSLSDLDATTTISVGDKIYLKKDKTYTLQSVGVVKLSDGENSTILTALKPGSVVISDGSATKTIVVNLQTPATPSFTPTADDKSIVINNAEGMIFGISETSDTDDSKIKYTYSPDNEDKVTISGLTEGKTYYVWGKYIAVKDVSTESAGAKVSVTTKKNITGKVTFAPIADQTYNNGTAIEAKPDVYVGNDKLRETTDFDFSWENNKNVGTATVKITGTGDYCGTASTTFKIKKATQVAPAIATALGSAIETTTATSYKIEKADSDYQFALRLASLTTDIAESEWKSVTKVSGINTVEFTNLSKGTAYKLYARLKATANLEASPVSSDSKTITTSKASIADATVIVAAEPAGGYVYSGAQIKPAVTKVSIGDKVLEETSGSDKDYKITYENNIDAGTASIVVTGLNDYAGTKKVINFKIAPKSVSDFAVGLSGESIAYSGQEIKPTVSILGLTESDDNGKSGDFTVKYENNVNVGKAKVTVTGVNNYTGTVSKEFSITQLTPVAPSEVVVAKKADGSDNKTMDSITVEALKAAANGPAYQYEYAIEETANKTGDATKVTWQNGTTFTGLKAGTSYTVYARIKADTSATKNWKESPMNTGAAISTYATYLTASNTRITVTGNEVVYDGSDRASAPSVAVKFTAADGKVKTLTPTTDYAVSYKDAKGNDVAAPTNVGTYSIYVTGANDYSQTVLAGTLTIKPAEVSLTISNGAPNNGKDYDGTNKIELEATPTGLVAADSSKKVTIIGTLNDSKVGTTTLDSVDTSSIKIVDGGTVDEVATKNYTFSEPVIDENFEVTITQNSDILNTISDIASAPYGSVHEVKLDTKVEGIKATISLDDPSDSEFVSISGNVITVKKVKTAASGVVTINVTAPKCYDGSYVATTDSFDVTTTKANPIVTLKGQDATATLKAAAGNPVELTPVIKVETANNRLRTLTDDEYDASKVTISYSKVGGSPVTYDPKKVDTWPKEEGVYVVKTNYAGNANVNVLSPAVNTILVIGLCEHENLEVVDAVEATCDKDGNIAYTYCPDCKKYFDMDGAEITLEDTVVKAKGHKQVTEGVEKATFDESGYTGDVVCKECGKLIKRGQKIYRVSSVTVANGTYNGKAQLPKVVVKDSKGKVLGASDYSVVYKNNVNAGKGSVVVTLKGKYAGTKTINFTIAKAKQSITKAVVKKTLKASLLKKKAASFKINAKAKGKVSYAKVSGSKNITVSKAGTVTIKKGTKKGTYTIKVKITAAATSNFNKATVTKTIKVVVK